jgi:hypothetical protein
VAAFFIWVLAPCAETNGITFVVTVKATNQTTRRVLELDPAHNDIHECMDINQNCNRVLLNEGIGRCNSEKAQYRRLCHRQCACKRKADGDRLRPPTITRITSFDLRPSWGERFFAPTAVFFDCLTFDLRLSTINQPINWLVFYTSGRGIH